MNKHHTSLYNSTDNKSDNSVLKQELVTYERTDFGLKINKLTRTFSDATYDDVYTSTPLVLSDHNS